MDKIAVKPDMNRFHHTFTKLYKRKGQRQWAGMSSWDRNC